MRIRCVRGRSSSHQERTRSDGPFLIVPANVPGPDQLIFMAEKPPPPGTSEEKPFVRMPHRQMDQLREKHEAVYLVRNEGHFKVYNFADGQAFEPDFVLSLRQKSGKRLRH